MGTQQYSIREYKESDLDMVLDLWEYHSEWGRPGKDEFRKWMITPFGNCIVYVAENTIGEIVGQLYLTPNELLLNGMKRKVLKSSAPIVHSEHRSTSMFSMDSVLIQLIVESYQATLKTDFHLIYSFPAFGWMRLLQSIHHIGLKEWKVQPLSCIEILENEIKQNDYELRLLDQFTDDIQSLTEKFKNSNEKLSYFTRDIRWLNYKWGDDVKIAIYDKFNSLIGYAAVRANDGLLLDMVVPDKDLISDVLVLIKNFVEDMSINDNLVNAKTLRLMQTRYLQPFLKDLRTKTVDHQFVFGISSLTNDNQLVDIDIDSFYIFPLD